MSHLVRVLGAEVSVAPDVAELEADLGVQVAPWT